jgi:putative transposase
MPSLDQTGAQAPSVRVGSNDLDCTPRSIRSEPQSDNISMNIREHMYPEERELPVLIGHCADARYLWNLALEQRNLWAPGRTERAPKSPTH